MINRVISKMTMKQSLVLKLNMLVFLLVTSTQALAGFLDMPEISETPELRGKTMLRDIDIPNVRDRNPDPNSGPRLAVSEFRIQGLVEYPEMGITREVLDKLVERLRFVYMGEGKLLESGYTLDELGQLSDLLVEIEDETLKRHVSPLEVQKLVWLVREQRSKRGITLGQIEVIADKITKFYRERGFILAKAYIPKQEVREGIVNLTLLLGMLGEVNVSGNKLYSENVVKSVFDNMMTKPVTHAAVEENLYLINDYPGITVDGYFEPGYQVGDTKLNINVKDEKRYNFNTRIDNHGTDDTGLYRLYADGQVNNLIGVADLVNLSLLKAESPSNTEYWRFMYQMNMFHPRLRFNIGTSRNQYVLDNSTDINVIVSGTVDVSDSALTYVLKRSRAENYKLEYKYEDLQTDLVLNETIPVSNEKLKNHSLTFYYDFLNEKTRALHTGNVKIKTGKYNDSGNSELTDSGFEYLSTDYTLLTFGKMPLFDANMRIIFRASLQYAGKKLSSLLRSSLGGPTKTRAYQSHLFSADDTFYTGVDLVFNSPDFLDFNIMEGVNVKELVKPFVFADYSLGRQNENDPTNELINDNKAELFNLGLGLQFSHGANFKGNLAVAFPTHHDFFKNESITYEKETRWVFDFQYSF